MQPTSALAGRDALAPDAAPFDCASGAGRIRPRIRGALDAEHKAQACRRLLGAAAQVLALSPVAAQPRDDLRLVPPGAGVDASRSALHRRKVEIVLTLRRDAASANPGAIDTLARETSRLLAAVDRLPEALRVREREASLAGVLGEPRSADLVFGAVDARDTVPRTTAASNAEGVGMSAERRALFGAAAVLAADGETGRDFLRRCTATLARSPASARR